MLPWFQYTVIQLGPLPIQVWGSWVALGMILTLVILWRRVTLSDRELVIDLAMWMIIGGLVFARAFHVLLYEPRFYLHYPVEILKVWHGGLSSLGGIAGAVIGFFTYAWGKHLDHKRLTALADLISFAALFGWMVGRIGCFMIHDHLGVHSNCPFAIRMPGGPRLDMALMEILGLVPLAIIFLILRKKSLPAGFFTASLFVYYGVLRFILDFWRARDIVGADARYAGLTPAQYGAILLVIMGGYFFFQLKRRKE